MLAARFELPDGPAIELTLPARLASWNAREHPDQVALKAWVSHVTERLARAERALEGPLALRLDIGLPDRGDPLWQRDLDNYLSPVARALPDRYVSIWATKGPARSSSVRVGPARELRAQPGGWSSFDVAQGPRSEDALKRAVAAAVRDATELPAGPVGLEIGFVDGGAGQWSEAWKPLIDGLEAVLGCTYAEPAWNPQDGRIVRLGVHRAVRPEPGRDVAATIWLRAAPLEWEENRWLRAMTPSERDAFMRSHLARAARSQLHVPSSGSRRRGMPAGEPGVVVFDDDDAGYDAWLRATPAGFVLNALRGLGAGTVLHRATCRSVSVQSANGTTWTAGGYVKVCAAEPELLTRWLEANGAQPARACGLCLAEAER